jgi:hypothetical protein
MTAMWAPPLPPARRSWHDPGVQILLGVVTVVSLYAFWYQFEPLLTFRPVTAKVIGAAVAPVTLRASMRGRPSNVTRYEPEIFFKYDVGAAHYLGARFRRTNLEFSDAAAQQRVGAYPAGRMVQAWYNPLAPGEAVLSRSPNLEAPWFPTFLIALFWFCAYTTKVRPASPPPSPKSAPID